MKNIKIVVEYDGTAYHGWQSQRNAVAIQDVIEAALENLTGEEIKLTGSGRTDAGVHAFGQVANFRTSSSIPPQKISYALNGVLPRDIVVKHSREVKAKFHSRYDAKAKKYKYIILNSEFPTVFMRDRAWHIRTPLDCDAMREALKGFLGTHDFSSFMSSGSSVESTVRTVFSTCLHEDGECIEVEVTANGFLYNMMRIIVGTLVEVGTGEAQPGEIPGIVESGKREKAGITAPAHGLYLVKVYYDSPE